MSRLRLHRAVVVLVLLGIVSIPVAGPTKAEERRVVIGRDGRERLDAREARRYAATGVVECGGMRGIGQLTGAADVVTSAAHLFFDEAGRPRADHGRCVFVLETPAGRTTVPIVPDARLCGSTSPYGEAGRHDWAAVRLARPVSGVRPYGVGGRPAPGEAVVVVAFERGSETSQLCRVRAVMPSENGAREIRTDCTGFDGMSGAAYLTPGARPAVVGIHVGFRSTDPDRVADYSDRHHTFGSAIDGTFRRALARAEGPTSRVR